MTRHTNFLWNTIGLINISLDQTIYSEQIDFKWINK